MQMVSAGMIDSLHGTCFPLDTSPVLLLCLHIAAFHPADMDVSIINREVFLAACKLWVVFVSDVLVQYSWYSWQVVGKCSSVSTSCCVLRVRGLSSLGSHDCLWRSPRSLSLYMVKDFLRFELVTVVRKFSDSSQVAFQFALMFWLILSHVFCFLIC